MKRMVFLLAVVVVAMAWSQGLSRRTLGPRAVLNRPTPQVQLSLAEKRFLEDNPTGTNEFNRSFRQQQVYEQGFDLKSFLGYEFGNAYTNGMSLFSWSNDAIYKERLDRPFRMFNEIELGHTKSHRLYWIELSTNTVNITAESLSNEVAKISAILSRTYQIGISWYRGERRFDVSSNLSMLVSSKCDLATGKGRVSLKIRSDRVKELDENIARMIEKQKEREVAARSKSINIGAEEGADLLLSTEIVLPEKAKSENAKCGTVEDEVRQNWANQEYWADWPRSVREGSSNYVAAVKAIESRFKVALIDMNGAPKWNVGEGRSCIKYCASDGVYFEKYDADGRLVLVSNERSDFEELKAFDERREVLLKEEREVWAKAKGITYEDAMSRSNEWQNVGLRGSLRARRLRRQQEAAAAAAKQREEHAAKDAERQACAEQEKRQREAERAEQRQQLLEIQEELKRVREAKTAANAEGRE